MIRRHPAYRPERRTEAAELYAQLGSIRKVAAAMNLGSTRVHQLLREAGALPKEKK